MDENRFPEQKAHFVILKDGGTYPAKLMRKCSEAGTDFTPRTVYRWYRGECQISENNASTVIAALGLDCSVAWLRGESEYWNAEAEASAFMDKMKNQEDAFGLLLVALSALSSYNLMSRTSFKSGEMSFESGEAAAKLEHALIISSEGKQHTISGEAVDRIRRETTDFVDFLLTRAIE